MQNLPKNTELKGTFIVDEYRDGQLVQTIKFDNNIIMSNGDTLILNYVLDKGMLSYAHWEVCDEPIIVEIKGANNDYLSKL